MKIDGNHYVLLGHCRKPHGIKGGFTVGLFNREDSVLRKGLALYIKPENNKSSVSDDGELVEIASINFKNKAIMYLKDINDRNTVESMVPFAVYCQREDFPELKEGEIYLQDLIGFDVIAIESHKHLGKVSGFSDNGVQDILHITQEQDTFELLFIDQFVHDIDVDKKEIVVFLPEYL